MIRGSRSIPSDILEAVHRVVEANRHQCLWFMKDNFMPRTVEEADRALAEVEIHGDRQAWAEARELRAWLSRTTSAAS